MLTKEDREYVLCFLRIFISKKIANICCSHQDTVIYLSTVTTTANFGKSPILTNVV